MIQRKIVGKFTFNNVILNLSQATRNPSFGQKNNNNCLNDWGEVKERVMTELRGFAPPDHMFLYQWKNIHKTQDASYVISKI